MTASNFWLVLNIRIPQEIPVFMSMYFNLWIYFPAMFLVMMGYDDRTVEENLFTRWFSAGLGLIILSLGEYEVLTGSHVWEKMMYVTY